MIAEKSYGIIPLRFQNEQWMLFLVCHQAGHWAFPKGHPEKRESPEQTAKRELREETGLSIIRFFSPSPIEERYTFSLEEETIEKTVFYYLAEVQGKEKLQEKEISDGAWLNFHEAKKRITFREGRRVCEEAEKMLREYFI